MKNCTNIDKALEIAKELGIKPPQKFIARVEKNKEIAKDRIKYWKRKKRSTYCGQYGSDVMIRAGYDIEPLLKGKNLWSINTTGQYENALDSVKKGDLIEITAEQAFYLAAIARPTIALSPRNMIVNGKPYNHEAIIWAIMTKEYNPEKGPAISQQGWYSLCPGWMSSRVAWGKVWEHEMVKYFLPDLT